MKRNHNSETGEKQLSKERQCAKVASLFNKFSYFRDNIFVQIILINRRSIQQECDFVVDTHT